MADTQQNTQPTKDIPKIPESIAINGVTFVIKDTPELLDLISTAAKVEKSKLYSKINALKTEMEQLNRVELEIPKTLKEDILSGVEEKVKAIVQPLLEQNRQIQTNSVEEYRNRLLADNAGNCFPELVKGNTKEELDASLNESKQLYDKYNPNAGNNGKPVVDPVIQQQTAQLNNTNGQSNTPNAAPGSNGTQTTQPVKTPTPVPNVPVTDATTTDIGKMSMEEFEKNRERLRREIEQM